MAFFIVQRDFDRNYTFIAHIRCTQAGHYLLVGRLFFSSVCSPQLDNDDIPVVTTGTGILTECLMVDQDHSENSDFCWI